jgi:hypothetical protein
VALETSPSQASSQTNPTRGTAIDWAAAWARGTLGTLGRFQIRERLGDGGFGAVFRAFDPRLDRDVAIKVLKQANPSERVMERFFREARAVARLDHPNIVAVHDAGFDGGRCWVAYQLVCGRALWWYRDHHRMDAATAARIIRDLADALDHAHCMGVVHRDIKPANVIVDDQGRPRLIDFGLARRSDMESDLTREGAVVGTPAYMSPEQALGFSRQVDERSDVYSLGVIFYELLWGHRPQEPSTEPLQDAPESPTEASTRVSIHLSGSNHFSVPPELERICRKAMARIPSERHSTARVLSDELSRWLDRNRESRSQNGYPLGMGVLGVAVTLVVFLGIWAGLSVWKPGMGSMTGSATNHPPGPPARQVIEAAHPTEPVGSPHGRIPGPSRGKGSLEGGVRFIGNRETRLYHLATCPAVQAMAERNRCPLESPKQAVAEGFRPCEKCQPAVQ